MKVMTLGCCRLLAGVLFVTALLSSPSVFSQDSGWLEQDPCSNQVSRLKGRTPYAAFPAIRANRCQSVLPVLKEMYESQRGAYRDEILLLCAGLWNPDRGNFPVQAAKFREVRSVYLDLLRLALEAPSTAVAAARLAEHWEVGEELKEELGSLVRRAGGEGGDRFAKAYLPALKFLLSEKGGGASSDLEDAYVALLSNSSTAQGIEVNQMAATALGELRSENPEAIKGLIKGLFLVSTDAGTTFKESLEALLKIGAPTVPYLVDVLESGPGDEKVKYLREFAVKNAIPEWKWHSGMKIPLVLAQLRDERSAATVIGDLGRPIIEPAGLSNSLRMDWTIAQTNRIKFDSFALMSTFEKGVMVDALRTIRGRSVEGSARLQLSFALAFNFTPEGLDTLFRTVHETELEQGDLPPLARESDFVIRFLQPLAYAVDYRNLQRFQDIFVDGFDENFWDISRAEDINEKLQQVDITVLLRVPQVCREELDCYLEVLRGNPWSNPAEGEAFNLSEYEGVDVRETAYIHAMARTKAALVLGRWKADQKQRVAILGALGKVYSALPYDSELYDDLRRALMLGLERQGRETPDQTAAAIGTLVTGEAGKGAAAVVWNQRLRALQHFLGNRRDDK
jgi:hypothetical protein